MSAYRKTMSACRKTMSTCRQCKIYQTESRCSQRPHAHTIVCYITVKCLKDVATYLLHIGHLQLKQLGVVLVPGSSNEVNRKGFDCLAEET